MVIPLPPLDAFRADRDQATQPSAEEGAWLQVAVLAHRAAALPPHERAAHHATLRTLHAPDGGDVVDVLLASALRMEDAAYFHLALSTFDAALRQLPATDVDRRGLLTAYQARVLRRLGEHALAREKYDVVIEMGETLNRPSLVARGVAGLGLLAQARGNLPDARQCFNRALRIEEAAPDTRRVAHQGLMICHGSAGDLSGAARHAWAAYVGSEGAERAEALIDLSEILLRSGNERAALSGFAAAVRGAQLPRFEFAALGGLAIAAAHAAEGDLANSLVRGADRRITALSMSASIPYLQACALADVADAFSTLGNLDEAGDRRARARELASRHGFHEILFRLESATTADERRARHAERESTAPWEIVQAIEAITSPDLLTATALELCEA